MALRIIEIEADDLFNLPVYEHHLVIDSRCAEEYAAGHVATAVSLPAPAAEEYGDEANEARLVSFVLHLVEEGLNAENISPIVLYGGGASAEDSKRFMHWLAERLAALKANRPLQVATLGGGAPQSGFTVLESDEYQPVLAYSTRLRDHAKDIWILSAGYSAFEQRYPFLCGDVQFEDLVPMPHRITSSIFMGSRPFKITIAEDVQWLKELGISHLIVDQEHRLASENDLMVLRCGVKDDLSGDMTACFDASILAINEAVGQGCCVLVQVHGRSRSASIIIAWLMQMRRYSFDAALQLVAGRCWKPIDASLIFADQLKKRQLPLAISPGSAAPDVPL